jgi:hypothetical protein
VSLSQPLSPELETQTVLQPVPVSRWRRLLTPSFGIAASIAAMAVIAVLVLQLPEKNTAPSAQNAKEAQGSPEAKSATEAKAALPTNETAPATSSSAASSDANKSASSQPVETRSATAAAAAPSLADRAAPSKELQVRGRRDEPADMKTLAGLSVSSSVPAAKAPVFTASLKKDYVNTNFFAANGNEGVGVDGQADKDIPSAPQPQPLVNNGFIAGKTKMPAFADIPPNTSAKPNVSLLTPVPPPQHFGCTVCKIVTAGAHSLHLRSITPIIRGGAVSDSAMGAPGMFSSALAKSQPTEVAAAPEKSEGGSLASSGALGNDALAVYSNRARESTPTAWKVAGGKLIKSSSPSQWEDAYPVASVQFSFVNARGNDVWAGGNSAFLIHSRDGGSAWEIVRLGDAATGTIVNILAGTLNIQVKTSDNQLWSSADGGKTWSLQSE